MRSVLSTAGLVPRAARRYRAQQMALWIDLIPRLHRAPNLNTDDFGPSDSACQHQLDNDLDSTFEDQATRVSPDPDCRHRKPIPTDQLPVSGITSFPVVTPRPARKGAEQRRTTRSYVTPRYVC